MSSETPNGGQKKPAIPLPAKKDAALNIGQRGDRLYEVNNLHKWFAISNLLLFVFTVWMILYDYNREWKQYQRSYSQLTIQQTQQAMDTAANAIDRNQFDQLQGQLAQAQANLVSNEGEVDRIQGVLDDLNAEFYAADQDFRFARARYDVERYDYEDAVVNDPDNAESAGVIAETTLAEINAFELRVEELTLAMRDAQDELNTYVGQRDQTHDSIDDALEEFSLLQGTMDTINPGLIVTSFRNAPVLDMLNPSEKIRQILLPNLHNEHPFMQIPRVDRCTTCHLGIDQPSFADAPQPFTTHPELEKFVGSNSPHAIDQFGCTSCHAGLDRAVEFTRAGHSPVDGTQREEWEEAYGWEEQHFLETPMLPLNRTEASCLKCHTGGGDVPEAPSLNLGRDLVRTYGCFGCHRIPGYEDVGRVGPDLRTIDSKLDSDWVKRWLREPRAFKSEARMPQFWFNSNNSGPEDEARNNTEISVITEFLFSKSRPNPLPPDERTETRSEGRS